MKELKLFKYSGYIYDLISIFFFHFNKDQFTKLFGNMNEKDKIRMEKRLESFSPCSDDLYLFFHISDFSGCFLTHRYLSSSTVARLAEEESPEFWFEMLADRERLFRRLIKFYFYQLPEGEIEACLQSRERLFAAVKESELSDVDKLRLYEYILNPDYYAQKLMQELRQKSIELDAYYEKHWEEIVSAFEGLTYEDLLEQYSVLRGEGNIDYEETIFVSFNLLQELHLCFYFSEKMISVRLGIDYRETFRRLKQQKKQCRVDLSVVGNALSDENRVKMLEMMLKNGKITCKDLERTFRFAGSTAYHHLMILTRSKLVAQESDGKIMYYKIATAAFKNAIEQLESFITSESGEFKL